MAYYGNSPEEAELAQSEFCGEEDVMGRRGPGVSAPTRSMQKRSQFMLNQFVQRLIKIAQKHEPIKTGTITRFVSALPMLSKILPRLSTKDHIKRLLNILKQRGYQCSKNICRYQGAGSPQVQRSRTSVPRASGSNRMQALRYLARKKESLPWSTLNAWVRADRKDRTAQVNYLRALLRAASRLGVKIRRN